MKTIRRTVSTGFTLVEVILVVLIFSAIAGILYPNLRHFYKETYFENAVKDMAGVIDYARNRAYQDNAFLKLELDFEKRRYVLKKFNEAEENRKSEEFVAVSGRYGREKALPPGLQFYSGTSREIVFQPDGAAVKYQVILRGGSDRQAMIQSQGYFGKPEISFK